MSLNPPITDWKKTRVWIIGASTGIGAALALALLHKGAKVALSARRADVMQALVTGHEKKSLVLPLNLTQPEQIAEAEITLTETWGGYDLVLFVAGDHKPMRSWEIKVAEARHLVEINLMGVVNALPIVITQFLRQQKGHIAIVASVGGYSGLPQALIYGATKAACINMAETLYMDLQQKNIAVTLINPGFVKTPLTDINDFNMPALVSAEEAATQIISGLEKGRFEIHFPRRFTLWLKLLRILPYRVYFYLIHKVTGL
ncbi:MAG: SDR family NAD(P)-dependent oxidoreductase [Burkholderiales bacterium]